MREFCTSASLLWSAWEPCLGGSAREYYSITVMNSRGKAFHYKKGCWTSLEFIFRLIFFSFTEQSDQILVQNICKEEHSRRIMKCFNDPRCRRIKYVMGYVDYKVEHQSIEKEQSVKIKYIYIYIYKGPWNLALYWNKCQNTAVCYLWAISLVTALSLRCNTLISGCLHWSTRSMNATSH